MSGIMTVIETGTETGIESVIVTEAQKKHSAAQKDGEGDLFPRHHLPHHLHTREAVVALRNGKNI